MSTQTFTTICPCFPGFYESYLSFDSDREQDYIDGLAEYWDIPHEVLDKYFEKHELDFNNSEYEAEISRTYCDYVAEELGNWLSDGAIAAFVKVVSPKFYNFVTDQAIMNIKLNPDDVIDQCSLHYEAFEEYLHAHFTPRSGFIPFYDPDPEWWLDIKNWSEPIVLGTILDFIFHFHVEEPEQHLSELTMEKIDVGEYITLPKGMDEFLYDNVENGLDELNREYDRLMEQPRLYLEAMRKQGNPPEKYTLEISRGKARVIEELAEEMAEKIASYAS